MVYDVAVIGAGIIGCGVARELSRYNCKAVLIEKENDVAMGTTRANSAIIHAGYDPEPGTLMAKYNAPGNRMAGEICEELDVPFKRCGSFVLAFSEEEMETVKKLYDRGVANGVPDQQILSGEEVRKMEPNVNETCVGALYAPSAGIVNPWEFALAMGEQAVENGVELKLCWEVSSIEKENENFVITGKNGEKIEAKFVVNAAGVYSDTVANMIGDESFSIDSSRGQYYLLDKSQGELFGHVMFQCPGPLGKGVLVAPTVHGNTIVGPTAIDIEDKDGVNTTAAGLDDVMRKASIIVKDAPLRQVITSFAGLRAHEDGHEFIIGEVENAPGFIDCAGIESPGLSSSPAIGKMVAEIVRDKLLLPRKSCFKATRKGILNPATLSFEERQALIRENSAYGNIICRCESITEGEILDAIHRPLGARSLDGVKRRVRAGMGRCQGGFCAPRVMEILSRELNIPMEEITKSGGASKLIVGVNKDSLEGGAGNGAL